MFSCVCVRVCVCVCVFEVAARGGKTEQKADEGGKRMG